MEERKLSVEVEKKDMSGYVHRLDNSKSQNKGQFMQDGSSSFMLG
jgi:hypothetical protein